MAKQQSKKSYRDLVQEDYDHYQAGENRKDGKREKQGRNGQRLRGKGAKEYKELSGGY